MLHHPRSTSLILTSALCCSAATSAQIVVDNTLKIKLDEVANISGSGAPNYGIHAGDQTDRLFVAGQNGEVRIIDGSALLTTPFLDIPVDTDIPIGSSGETGLLGIAFHPNYAELASTPGSGKFYTYTSEGRAGKTPDFNHPELVAGDLGSHHSVIREWTVSTNPNQIDTSGDSPSRELMRINQPQSNHNGGALAFGPDDNLYISLGDGGGANDNSGGINHSTDGHSNGGIGNSQDITNILGTIVRIEPLGNNSNNQEYGIPNTNPFVGMTGVDEIFAYGLRNPFRISFDSLTGDLYAGDVGQGSREEVDLIVNNGNYGWVYYEGTEQNRAGGPDFEDTVAPIAEYDNDGDGIAVIGGFVYRGTQLPQLIGRYIFGDLCGPSRNTGRLFYLDLPDGPIHEFDIDSGDAISSTLNGFGEDSHGEIYLMMGSDDVLKIIAGPGDFNSDQAISGDDIDLLRDAVNSNDSDPQFNVDGQGGLDQGDFDHMISDILATGLGDADLNRNVNFVDFVRITNNFELVGSGWSEGNFNLDNTTDFGDFILLSNNFDSNFITIAASAVPEPSTIGWLMMGVVLRWVRHNEHSPL